MADPVALLDELRPLHNVASGVDGAAPIVAMTLLGCAAALILTFTLGPWLARRRALRREALENLAATRALPAPDRLAAQAAILRRLVRSVNGAAARERGDAWLDSLDLTFSTRFFSKEQGEAFGDALYRPVADLDVAALDAALERLFARIER
ncbi:MAG: DUF4381 family protein [Methylocella sp.]